MTDDDDKESLTLARMRMLLAEVLSAWYDRPHDALLLMKEAYATYQSMHEEDRKLLDEPFQHLVTEVTTPN
jgi:hypothetical protein